MGSFRIDHCLALFLKLALADPIKLFHSPSEVVQVTSIGFGEAFFKYDSPTESWDFDNLVPDSTELKNFQKSNDGNDWAVQTNSEDVVLVSGSSEQVKVTQKMFESRIKNYLYLPGNSDTTNEETVLVWTVKGEFYVSSNQGSDWVLQKTIKQVVDVFKSDTDDCQVFVYTGDSAEWRTVHVSWDRAKTFEKVRIPAEPQMSFFVPADLLSFHPQNRDWMLFIGKSSAKNCDFWNCESVSYLSKDRGKSWKEIYTGKCHWIYGLALQDENEELVFCTSMDKPALPSPDDDDYTTMVADKVFWSTDYFASEPQPFAGLEKTLDFSRAGKFLLALSLDGKNQITQVVSRDGKHFEPLKYPSDTQSSDEVTLLTFDENSLWMFNAVSTKFSDLYGTIFKSDAQGTENIKVLENVNRATGVFSGYVDFDRLESVEGVAIANVVVNADDVMRKGVEKQLKTVITHSDGSMWAPLLLKDNQKLNLHGYSERLDRRNTPSSPTAVGVFLGRGNMGETLGDLRSAQTYMTRDAGMTWTEIAPRPMFWEFGDSGSIIVLVDSLEPTDTIRYSVDDGINWLDFKFSEFLVKIINLVTMPSDTSRKFIIFATAPLSVSEGTLAFQLDFSGQVPICKDSDFEWWNPAHPQLKSNCLLGRETQYKRKIAGRKCSVGKHFEDPKKKASTEKKMKNCKCTQADLECDFNYELKDGKCILAKDAKEPTKKEQCANGAVAYRNVNGYRLISSSTCEGADELINSKFYACPGKEAEFKDQYGDGNKGRIGWPPSKPSVSPSKPENTHSKTSDTPNPSSTQKPKQPPTLDPELPKKRSLGWVPFFLIALFAFVGAGAYRIYRRKFDTLQLPAYNMSGAVSRSRDVVQKVFVQAEGIWELIRVNIPLFGSRVPQDHLGFYSRMGDDDRYRFEDDEDEGENVPFTDDAEQP